MKDEFGRSLPADIDLTFLTDDRPPRFVLTHPVSVLETEVETHVPVTVTNLEEVRARFNGVTPGGVVQSTVSETLPEVCNIAYGIPLDVREWLGGGSGALLGNIESNSSYEQRPSLVFLYRESVPGALESRTSKHRGLGDGSRERSPRRGRPGDFVFRNRERARRGACNLE